MGLRNHYYASIEKASSVQAEGAIEKEANKVRRYQIFTIWIYEAVYLFFLVM